jgi:hypothetical protein
MSGRTGWPLARTHGPGRLAFNRTVIRTIISPLIPALLVTFGLATSAAADCADGYYDFHGVCLPNSSTAVQNATRPLTEAEAEEAGVLLETWINASRGSAYSVAQPIPADIRCQLEGFIDDEILDSARFEVGDNGILNLAGLTVKYGDAFAVTVNDVIVFKNGEIEENAAIWAHELTHVKQYRDWGVHNFAVSYIRDWHSVEDPAYSKQAEYGVWLRDGGNGRQCFAPPPPNPNPLPPPRPGSY